MYSLDLFESPDAVADSYSALKSGSYTPVVCDWLWEVISDQMAFTVMAGGGWWLRRWLRMRLRELCHMPWWTWSSDLLKGWAYDGENYILVINISLTPPTTKASIQLPEIHHGYIVSPSAESDAASNFELLSTSTSHDQGFSGLPLLVTCSNTNNSEVFDRGGCSSSDFIVYGLSSI